MTTTNTVMYFLTSLITNCFETLTRTAFKIEAVKERKLIMMKNEFYYKRIMLTNSKKNYSGIITMQEGNLLDPPKHDIKGLAIKKVSTNKRVRTVFTKLLKENILSSEKINVSEILKSYSELETDIKTSLSKGEILFVTPGRVNTIDSYKNPYTQQTVRGSIIWNELYPSSEIVFPDKINFVKLKDISYDEIIEIFDKEVTCISNDEKERIVTCLENVIFKEPEMSKYGFKVICMPKSIMEMPKWLIHFIDIDSMIESNMKPGFKMLESLEFKILSYQVGNDKGEKASNIISI